MKTEYYKTVEEPTTPNDNETMSDENTEPSIWARLDLDTERAGYTELWIQSAIINLEYMRANLERGNDESAAKDIRQVKYALREAMCSIQGASCTVPSRTSIV